MLVSLNEAKKLIETGKFLHISGDENLIKKLPKGNWIGGSINYFMYEEGGIVSDEKLFIDEIQFDPCKIETYDTNTIESITNDAYENGFTIVIMPFGSEIRNVYSLKASEIKDIFLKNVVGWISGGNLSLEGQTPIVINGQSGEYYTDKAVALHVSLPEDKIANIGIINIFSSNKNSPIIEFAENSDVVENCIIDGKETALAEYLDKNNIDIKVPIIGDYFGANINATFFSINDNKVTFGAPVFAGVKYRFGNPVADYPAAFTDEIKKFSDVNPVFCCNCASNFLFGELEGKKIETFFGPMSFGEIAYQLLNQTLVYLMVS